MTRCVFVDESKRRDFVLVAGAVLSDEVTVARQTIRGLHRPGQRGIHMVKESSGRQRTILATIADLGIEVSLYVAPKESYKTQLTARKICLEQLIGDLSGEEQTDVTIERDETVEATDRKLIRDQLRHHHAVDRMRYLHSKVAAEPLLLIPDAIGWAWPQKVTGVAGARQSSRP